jgi:hypothetical protein
LLSLFKKLQTDERTLAAAAYEKVVSLTQDTREARSMRVRMALLCRNHLDKTFVAGAELTSAYLDQVALSIARGQTRPEPPEFSCFQYITTSKGEEVCAYLPEEFASEAFALGGLYQRMQMDAQQVIGAMQNLADRLFIEHIKLTATLPVLQFLREEIGMTTAAEPDLAHMPPADESH